MNKPVTALLLCCACALAQPHPAVAIRNAKIVTVSGTAIAKGTVVVRKGLIEAVGENVPVPADAMIVEGEGLTVYPGLIDSLSTVGQPGAATVAPAATAGRGGRGQQATPSPATPANPLAALAAASATTPAPVARGPEDRPQTTRAQSRRRSHRWRPAHRKRAERGIHFRRQFPHPRHLRRTGRRNRPAHGRKARR